MMTSTESDPPRQDDAKIPLPLLFFSLPLSMLLFPSSSLLSPLFSHLSLARVTGYGADVREVGLTVVIRRMVWRWGKLVMSVGYSLRAI